MSDRVTWVFVWLRRNALNIALALTSATGALAVYSIVEVGNERAAAILRECQSQNQRNTATLRYIHNFGVAEAKRQHISVAKAEAGLKPFVLLMDAAIPHQNCRQLLAKSTSTK